MSTQGNDEEPTAVLRVKRHGSTGSPEIWLGRLDGEWIGTRPGMLHKLRTPGDLFTLRTVVFTLLEFATSCPITRDSA